MAIRALHKAKFQQLGISDLQTAQEVKGETLAPNLEITFNPIIPIPEVELTKRWDGGDRRGVLWKKHTGSELYQSSIISALGQILTHPWTSAQLESVRCSRIETELYFHFVWIVCVLYANPETYKERSYSILVDFLE